MLVLPLSRVLFNDVNLLLNIATSRGTLPEFEDKLSRLQ